MNIRAGAGSKISIAWGNGRITTHSFDTETEMRFINDYFPGRSKPPQGRWFQVEISAENQDCRIIGFYMGGDMNNNNLDVSNCPELEELYYFEYNIDETYNLDLSRNVALKYLNCARNGIASLDLSHCTELEVLDCYGNCLTSLDLSRNTALVELKCGGNRLSHLWLKNNHLLEQLYCEFNEMKRIYIDCLPKLRVAEFEVCNQINDATKRQIQEIIAENNAEE